MMSRIAKYNLELLTLIMFSMITICAVFFGGQLSLIQRMMLGFMFLFILHEWEEGRFPGGFTELMTKFFDVQVDEEHTRLSRLPVSVFLIAITFIPFFTQIPLLALPAVILGIFEAFIHLVGIKIHNMDKPYTPGLITALLQCVASVFSIILLSDAGLAQGLDYLWGTLIFFICFAAMQRTVIGIFGLGYKDIIANAKKKLVKKTTEGK